MSLSRIGDAIMGHFVLLGCNIPHKAKIAMDIYFGNNRIFICQPIVFLKIIFC